MAADNNNPTSQQTKQIIGTITDMQNRIISVQNAQLLAAGQAPNRRSPKTADQTFVNPTLTNYSFNTSQRSSLLQQQDKAITVSLYSTLDKLNKNIQQLNQQNKLNKQQNKQQTSNVDLKLLGDMAKQLTDNLVKSLMAKQDVKNFLGHVGTIAENIDREVKLNKDTIESIATSLKNAFTSAVTIDITDQIASKLNSLDITSSLVSKMTIKPEEIAASINKNLTDTIKAVKLDEILTNKLTLDNLKIAASITTNLTNTLKNVKLDLIITSKLTFDNDNVNKNITDQINSVFTNINTNVKANLKFDLFANTLQDKLKELTFKEIDLNKTISDKLKPIEIDNSSVETSIDAFNNIIGKFVEKLQQSINSLPSVKEISTQGTLYLKSLSKQDITEAIVTSLGNITLFDSNLKNKFNNIDLTTNNIKKSLDTIINSLNSKKNQLNENGNLNNEAQNLQVGSLANKVEDITKKIRDALEQFFDPTKNFSKKLYNKLNDIIGSNIQVPKDKKITIINKEGTVTPISVQGNISNGIRERAREDLEEYRKLQNISLEPFTEQQGPKYEINQTSGLESTALSLEAEKIQTLLNLGVSIAPDFTEDVTKAAQEVAKYIWEQNNNTTFDLNLEIKKLNDTVLTIFKATPTEFDLNLEIKKLNGTVLTIFKATPTELTKGREEVTAPPTPIIVPQQPILQPISNYTIEEKEIKVLPAITVAPPAIDFQNINFEFKLQLSQFNLLNTQIQSIIDNFNKEQKTIPVNVQLTKFPITDEKIENLTIAIKDYYDKLDATANVVFGHLILLKLLPVNIEHKIEYNIPSTAFDDLTKALNENTGKINEVNTSLAELLIKLQGQVLTVIGEVGKIQKAPSIEEINDVKEKAITTITSNISNLISKIPLSDKLNELKLNILSSIKDRINSLATKVPTLDAIEKQLSTFKDQIINTIAGKIESIPKALTKDEIDSLKNLVITAINSIKIPTPPTLLLTNISNAVLTIDQDIKNIQLTSINTSLSNISEGLSTIGSKLDILGNIQVSFPTKQLDDINSGLSTINTKLNGINITSINTSLSNITAGITTIGGKIDKITIPSTVKLEEGELSKLPAPVVTVNVPELKQPEVNITTEPLNLDGISGQLNEIIGKIDGIKILTPEVTITNDLGSLLAPLALQTSTIIDLKNKELLDKISSIKSGTSITVDVPNQNLILSKLSSISEWKSGILKTILDNSKKNITVNIQGKSGGKYVPKAERSLITLEFRIAKDQYNLILKAINISKVPSSLSEGTKDEKSLGKGETLSPTIVLKTPVVQLGTQHPTSTVEGEGIPSDKSKEETRKTLGLGSTNKEDTSETGSDKSLSDKEENLKKNRFNLITKISTSITDLVKYIKGEDNTYIDLNQAMKVSMKKRLDGSKSGSKDLSKGGGGLGELKKKGFFSSIKDAFAKFKSKLTGEKTPDKGEDEEKKSKGILSAFKKSGLLGKGGLGATTANLVIGGGGLLAMGAAAGYGMYKSGEWQQNASKYGTNLVNKAEQLGAGALVPITQLAANIGTAIKKGRLDRVWGKNNLYENQYTQELRYAAITQGWDAANKMQEERFKKQNALNVTQMRENNYFAQQRRLNALLLESIERNINIHVPKTAEELTLNIEAASRGLALPSPISTIKPQSVESVKRNTELKQDLLKLQLRNIDLELHSLGTGLFIRQTKSEYLDAKSANKLYRAFNTLVKDTNIPESALPYSLQVQRKISKGNSLTYFSSMSNDQLRDEKKNIDEAYDEAINVMLFEEPVTKKLKDMGLSNSDIEDFKQFALRPHVEYLKQAILDVMEAKQMGQEAKMQGGWAEIFAAQQNESVAKLPSLAPLPSQYNTPIQNSATSLLNETVTEAVNQTLNPVIVLPPKSLELAFNKGVMESMAMWEAFYRYNKGNTQLHIWQNPGDATVPRMQNRTNY